MAQKTEKEETEFKVPETMSLCVNNCGVTGNPALNNMCQKCFSASTTSTSNTSAAATTTTTMAGTAISTSISSGGILKYSGQKSPRSSSARSSEACQKAASDRDSLSDAAGVVSAKREVNRCSGCRRKVGLTGFRCRCGELFCWEHRYSDRHDCSYDYKTAGREAIARENPVVKAAKIVKV